MTAKGPDLGALRAALEQRIADLRAAADATSDDRKPVELDQASVGRLSRMDAMQVQAMAQASERMRRNEIARIEAAIKRIDAGDYGYCTRCGEEIAPQRLAVDPAIAVCIACASAKN